MGGTGWCTHPERQLSSDVRILVRKAELGCRNAWGVDFWEAKDGAATELPTSAAPSSSDAPQDLPMAIQGSFEDEVTSVVNTDIHRAQHREDLNDRVVEQTMGPDDDTETAEDDRFDLLARGGRDSVSQARNRMLRRRSGQQAPLADDEPAEEVSTYAEEQERPTFLPDDYVEEEAPAPEAKASDTADNTPTDDVILSEGISQGTTPRSRRLRRAREQSTDPKPEAVVGTDADVATPAIDSSQGFAPVQDRFDSIPEISSSIDLSRLRQREQRADLPEAQSPPPPASTIETPVVEDPFERAIRRAQIIKAETRSERGGRSTAASRPRAIAAPVLTPTPEILHDHDHDRADESVEEEPPRFDFGTSHSHHEPVRARISTRQESDHGPEEFDGAGGDVEIRTESASTTLSRRTDASTSWWRGLFRNRYQDDAPYDDGASGWADQDTGAYSYADSHDLDYESQPVTSEAAWDDVENDVWDDDVHQDVVDYPAPYIHAEVDPYDDIDSGYSDDAPMYEEPDHEPLPLQLEAAPPRYEPLDLQQEQGLSEFRDRLFINHDDERESHFIEPRADRSPRRSPISLARKRAITRDEPMRVPEYREEPWQRPQAPLMATRRALSPDAYVEPAQHLAPQDLLNDPADAWYEPEQDHRFDVRDIIAQSSELLDMTIEISPDIPRNCASCRSYRQSEKGERGWCTNNWAFTHRQMVNATDLACQSTIGCWWLPADEEVWLAHDEPERGPTPRVDRLVAHLDPLKRAVGR